MGYRRREKKSAIQAAMFWIGVVMALFWSVGRTVGCVTYNIEVGARLKRASDANTVEIALQEVNGALDGIKKRGVTSGYTSIVYNTPDEDLDFWYKNIVSAQTELRQLPADSSPLEKTNVLMKLRETLLDSGDSGMYVTAPTGVSIHPYTKLYGWGGAIGWSFVLVFGVWWFVRETV